MQTQTKPRILIVAGDPRFVQVFLDDQIRLLVKDGFDVLLVCPPGEGQGHLAGPPCTVKYLSMARTISPLADARSLVALYRTIGEWKPDVVHSHAPKAGLLASVAAMARGVRFRLHTIHGLRSDGLSGLRHALMQAMERLTVRCCTQCFAVSKSLERRVIAKQICPPHKVMVLGEGSWAGVPMERFNAPRFHASGADFRTKHGIPAHALVISCIGRIAKDKGIETLIEAWQHLKRRGFEGRLLVAGPLDDSDAVSTATLKTLRGDASITCIEEMVSDVPTLLAASNIFVQPSFREGLGVAALEASAMQLPVIASRVTGLTDAVQHEATGLVVPARDPHALMSAVQRLAKHPCLRRRLGANGRRFVEASFNRRIVLMRSLQMYREIEIPVERKVSAKGRLLDVAIAATVLCLASPLLAVTSLAVLLFMGRPIFFRQQRAGLHGRPFELIKFRTMKQPAKGQAMIGTDQARNHWLGQWLRRLSLDELPQLINVLRGEMRLVGPRPLLLDYVPRYSAFEARRHEVKPGITGWAQINGRNALSWSRKFELDVWYVDHQSFALDMRILLLTLERVVRPSGVTPPGMEAMPEFRGSAKQQTT